MIFPREKEKTNDQLSITIIDIQSILQRHGMGIHDHWHEQLNEVRYRLEAVEEAKKKMCDEYCRMPFASADMVELREFCKYFPLNEIQGVKEYDG